MKINLDNELVEKVDAISKELNISRSEFTMYALLEAVKQHNAARLEQKHRQGYAAQPVKKEEFSVWEKDQDWGDG